MRPLCPHCLRDSCPWLVAWKIALADQVRGLTMGLRDVPARRCPFADVKLAPNVAKHLKARLDAGVLIKLDFVPGDLVIGEHPFITTQDFYMVPMSHTRGHGHRTEEGE